MKATTAWILLLSTLLTSCSFEVENPKSQPGTNVGAFQMIVLEEGTGERAFYAFDTLTGALHERDGSRWREVVDPLTTKRRVDK